MNSKRPDVCEEFVSSISDQPMETATQFYAQSLPENDKAVAYLRNELRFSLEQAAEHLIGFSDRSLGRLLPTGSSQRGRTLRQKLTAVGLFKPTGHETLRGCITLPLRNEDGEISGLEGRRIDPNAKGPQVIRVGSGSLELPEQIVELPVIEVTTVPPWEFAPEAAHSHDDQDLKSDSDSTSTQTIPDLLVEEKQVTFVRDNRRYRVRGMERNTNPCTLRVNLMASRDGLVHLDNLDLVKARSRTSFIKAAAAELYLDAEIIKKDIGQLLLKLETLREQQIAAANSARIKTVELSDQQRSEAIDLLRDPNLLQRIVDDMDACGMVGEQTNKLAGYLAATSRKLAQPLAIMIQSSSSAGKTSLMDAVLAMIPDEEQLRFTGMTGQSLFYLDSQAIRHKVLAISEDEGIAEATYALKLLQSEGRLRHATVVRDESGNMVTRDNTVEGPVQIMLTTTAMEIDEELVNRCLVLSVDESRDQTDAIQAIQRDGRTLKALVSREKAAALQVLHQNAQRLLRPIRVINPYAPQLRFATDKTRTRRDHLKYLTLIDSVALLHQYQRTVRSTEIGESSVEFVSVEPADIAVANHLCAQILGQSLDELAPQTRHLLMLLDRYVEQRAKAEQISRSALHFTRREVREHCGMSDFQVHKHLSRLVELEYLAPHRGKQGSRYRYELLYSGEGQAGDRFVMGLIDPEQLTIPPSTTKTLGTPHASLSPRFAPVLQGLGGAANARNSVNHAASDNSFQFA